MCLKHFFLGTTNIWGHKQIWRVTVPECPPWLVAWQSVQNYIENGYARDVPAQRIPVDIRWYLPHHAVKHQRKGMYTLFWLWCQCLVVKWCSSSRSTLSQLTCLQFTSVSIGVCRDSMILHRCLINSRLITKTAMRYVSLLPIADLTTNPLITGCSLVCSVRLHHRASQTYVCAKWPTILERLSMQKRWKPCVETFACMTSCVQLVQKMQL